MTKIGALVFIALSLTTLPKAAWAQFTYGNYKSNAATLKVAAVTFKSGELLTFVYTLNSPGGCQGAWFMQYVYRVDRTYKGQPITQASSVGSGSAFCPTSFGGVTIVLTGSLSPQSAEFVENAATQIIVNGGALAGTYNPISVANKNVSQYFFGNGVDRTTVINYTIKRPGQRTRRVTGPIGDVYWEATKW
jgi:hypothetical protein